MDDSFEDAEQQAVRQKRIMEESRNIPIFLNDKLIFNAVINFLESSGLRPVNIRQKLQEQLTFFYSGDKTVTRTDWVHLYCNKGLMFLDYINNDPRLNTRLRIFIWPLQHVLGMRVKKADPAPEEIETYVSSPKKQQPPPRFKPATEVDENMNQHEIEDRYEKEPPPAEDLKKKMM